VLALAGDGGLLVPRAVRELGARVVDDWPGSLRSASLRQGGTPGGPYGVRGQGSGLGPVVLEASPARRQLLQAGALGAAALAVASLAVPLRFLRGRGGDDGGLAGGGSAGGGLGSGARAASGGTPSSVATQGPGTGPVATSTPAVANGMTIASISSVDQHGALRFRVPAGAPGSLPAGDPGIIVKLADGRYVAYDATCTHQGCRVSWDAQDSVLLCPCHGAAFDPSDHGAVLGGPTNQPLFELPIVVNHEAGTITIQA
jgi:thiosulfate dehydrogenase [quinone] large subunit